MQAANDVRTKRQKAKGEMQNREGRGGRWPLRAVHVRGESTVPASFRVEQCRGMFDLKKGVEGFVADVQVPAESTATRESGDPRWRIGAIVGPSGSGKSMVARAAYGKALYEGGAGWPAKGSVLDGFAEDLTIKQVTGMLTAVGFSSPPAWLRPYGVLSNGEKFRCDLARALLGGSGTVVFDEFTSVVDRVVAKVGSLAVAKALRAGRCDAELAGKKVPRGGRRFVAVTCHYDVLAWLQPDWVLDMSTGRLARGALCRRICGERPPLDLRICRCGTELWALFARHHYLTGDLHRAAVCYVAVLEGVPVAFCATLHVTGHAGRRNISRLVVLPDYQGIGIGRALLNTVAELTAATAGVKRVGLVTSHPGMIAAAATDRRWSGGGWRLVEQMRQGNARNGGVRVGAAVSAGRGVCRFAWGGRK